MTDCQLIGFMAGELSQLEPGDPRGNANYYPHQMRLNDLLDLYIEKISMLDC